MDLSDFSILTDENIQPKVVAYLESEGFNVKDVKTEGLSGSSDMVLLRLAFEENRVISTHDSDFGRLIFMDALEFVGIIYLRPGHFDPDFTIQSWKALTKAKLDLKPPFIIVVENSGASIKIRYRQM